MANFVRTLAFKAVRSPRWLAAIAVCGLLAAPAVSHAGPVENATFLTVSPGQGVSGTLGGNGFGTTGGVFQWNGNSGPIVGPFSAFCIELTQFIGFGGTYTYNVVPIGQAGIPDAGIFGPGTFGPMGAVRGDLLKELFGRHYSGIVDNSSAAAFQMDVWEIVYDGSRAPGALDLTSGNFTATSDAATDALAQSWLNSLDGTGPRANLVGLTNPEVQDQVTLGGSVPEPSALALSLCGLAGLAFAYRRR